jgi:hypothetical protein
VKRRARPRGYACTDDHAGEMTSETKTSTGDVWTYGYDLRGRMVTAVEKTSGGTVLESVTFTYDALDNRIGMDENSTQTWTLYDGDSRHPGIRRVPVRIRAPVLDWLANGRVNYRAAPFLIVGLLNLKP